MTEETKKAVQKVVDMIDLVAGDIADLHYEEQHRGHTRRRCDRLYLAFARLNEAADILEDYMEKE